MKKKEPFSQTKAVSGAGRDTLIAGGIPAGIVTILGQFGVEIPAEVAVAFVTVAIFAWRYLRGWWQHTDIVNF